MGMALLNERMLETYVHARKWLREGGTMFPTSVSGDAFTAARRHLPYASELSSQQST
jgi:hypothetical protein